MGIGKLLLRIVVGGIFVAHGMQKLTGAFGGYGIEGTAKMMASQKLHPPRQQALMAGIAEAGGGLALVLGLLTPGAAAAIDAVMLTAVRKVHIQNGFFAAQGGYEFNLTLAAAATALAIDGPGAISVDALFGRKRWGIVWGLLAAGAGVAGSTLAIELGQEAARRAEASSTGSDATVVGTADATADATAVGTAGDTTAATRDDNTDTTGATAGGPTADTTDTTDATADITTGGATDDTSPVSA